MRESNRESGYSCDIALEQLLELYASSSEFKRNLHCMNTRPELIQYRRKQLIKGRRKEPLFVQLIKHRDNYTWLTKEWRHDWKVLLKNIPDDARMEAEKIAEKWGLRCNWGCGCIISTIHFLNDIKATLTIKSSDRILTGEMNLSPFMLTPGPPNSTANLTTKISVSDTDDSIKQKLADLKKMAKRFQEITLKNYSALDYRGFEKHAKKDIATQVQWLFWHITPPYLNAAEIATRLQNTSGDVDPFYIQRCYQNMAKLLGIKLIKGWPKGRRRASQQTRAEMRGGEIEAIIGLKNDL